MYWDARLIAYSYIILFVITFGWLFERCIIMLSFKKNFGTTLYWMKRVPPALCNKCVGVLLFLFFFACSNFFLSYHFDLSMSGIKLWRCFIFSQWQRHMKPFHCCFQWCFVHFNIAERMMSLLQCMLITIHRQEKCMFSCLLFTREGVAIFKKRGFVINFIWMAPQKISYFDFI